MANEPLRATLSQAVRNYALERGRIFGRIQECCNLLFDAETNFKRVQDAERSAELADDEQVKKMRELMDYYNTRPEPRPQALLEQHAQMSAEQLDTHRKRMAAHDAARSVYSIVEERRRDLAVAEQELMRIDARITETNTEIENLNRQP
jgi:hypothetical protein